MKADCDAGTNDPSLSPTAHADMRDLLLAVKRLHRTLQQSIEDMLQPHQLSVTQWLIVSGLAHGSGQTLTDFSRLLDRDAGSLSRAIYQLTRRGVLSYRRNPQDRRSNRLVLTTTGRDIHDEVAPRVSQLISALGNHRMDAGHLSPMLARFASQVESCQREKLAS